MSNNVAHGSGTYSITSSARKTNDGGLIAYGPDIAACTVPQIGYIRAVGDQSAIGELSEEINRGQMMFCRERDNSRGLANGQNIAKNNDCVGALGGGRGKGDVEFLGRGRFNYRQSNAEVPGRAGYLLG